MSLLLGVVLLGDLTNTYDTASLRLRLLPHSPYPIGHKHIALLPSNTSHPHP